MASQRFAARERHEFSNGAVGWAPGGSMDCLGPFAKVQQCPVEGTDLRLTCYATAYADTMSSVPAYTRHKGRYISGHFTCSDAEPIMFVPLAQHHEALGRIPYARADGDRVILQSRTGDVVVYVYIPLLGMPLAQHVADAINQPRVLEPLKPGETLSYEQQTVYAALFISADWRRNRDEGQE